MSFFLLAAGVGGLLSGEVAEQLRYSRDILKPYAKWSVKDLSDSFFVAKPLAPDEYETLVAKYRERERADRAAKQQQQPQQQQQQHLANGQHRDRWVTALQLGGYWRRSYLHMHACCAATGLRCMLHSYTPAYYFSLLWPSVPCVKVVFTLPLMWCVFHGV
mgnify:CR=1 FL=1